MNILIIYIALFIGAYFLVKFASKMMQSKEDYTSLKTVTFGDESAVKANRAGSVLSVISLFLLWAAFTGSSLTPVHAPAPYFGDLDFTYTVEMPDGTTDDADIFARIRNLGDNVDMPDTASPNDAGPAKNDAVLVDLWSSKTILFDKNDEGKRKEGTKVSAINGQPISIGNPVAIENGSVSMSDKGALVITPDQGWQMNPLYLPSPEATWSRLVEIASDGYRSFTLLEHLGYSLFRVVIGLILGTIVGIPLGYAMGLNNWCRGWFDPIVEFMRPVPPLALIPLIIIWFGIGETGKIILLFLAALWIMAIAARSGVSGVKISKVHAAYSLGASKWQVLTQVIVPNSLPEIFTGARVAMGVCWGTVVAAELVAAQVGTGMMIMVASKFQLTDIVVMGIILIGVIGFSIDVLMRMLENWLIPWKGKG